jgi:CRP-like cAMP-binding protein
MTSLILLIEDNLEMCEDIQAILKLAQYDVVLAHNGKEGIALAHKYRPDLILCDIMMPGLDGYGVLHILSKDQTTAGIPFIFLTAKTDPIDVRTGMDLGADDYITKPFDGSALLNVIEVRLTKNERIRKSGALYIQDMDEFLTRAKELEEFQKLSSNRQIRHIRKKDFVFMEGLDANDLFIIHTGIVKTYKSTQDGKELVTGIHKPGEFIGFLPLIENAPYNETAIALEPTEVYLIPKDDFNTLLYTNHEVARNFIRLLSNDLYETEERLMEMAYQSVRQRVARALLKLCDQVCSPANGKVITLARKDISGMVGTATESLNRTLADFKEEGLISLTDSGIRILDKKKMERLSH